MPSHRRLSVRERFRRFSSSVAAAVGSPWVFALALLTILLWALSGPLFGFSDTWQLVINTCTTVVTFLMVFLIQNTQNRDARAIHLKLDELIHRIKGPRDLLVDLEDCTEEELKALEEEFRQLRARHDKAAAEAGPDAAHADAPAPHDHGDSRHASHTP